MLKLISVYGKCSRSQSEKNILYDTYPLVNSEMTEKRKKREFELVGNRRRDYLSKYFSLFADKL